MPFVEMTTPGQGGGGGISTIVPIQTEPIEYGTTHTISNKSGQILLIMLLDFGAADIPKDRFKNPTVSGGTATFLSNANESNAKMAGSFFQLNVTSDTCTVTTSYNSVIYIFGFE